ncbi:MAG: tetratricopeptide repeat protein [Gammaproteobacteria bacterium]|nr:tetratricopeptide repeat protein [Rhodocyclaceae bacterium]MBU3909159.1 tetratricopeptide repeat protein [Gammaproteobacteria bacterium]MBU3988332.1 tetratricopeptide repeat protein [Gammaproteobacteria bacterium]MBU4005681.1 tetratricopeptide repeat protein [Gammaproteobacteria bacterium]MBU4020766.1 tetratricopeptide repeat protein [Gammaproteobacteria bacterium]
MKPIFTLLIIAAILSSGSLRAEVPAPEAPAAETDEAAKQEEAAIAGLPNVELTPRLLYQFLLAEIAGQRGQFVDSAELYLDMAKRTRDPRLARRATEIAAHGRRMEIAQQSAQLWLDIEPASLQAHLTFINVLVAQGRYEELKTATAALLALAPQHIGQNLLRLNRLFARGEDRKAVRDLIGAVTAPYLQLPEAHYVRAVAAFDARDLAAAREDIQQALKLKPDWEAAVLLLAQMSEKNEAFSALEAFIAANPQARDVRLTYARALVADKRYTEGRRHFGVLLEQSDDPAKSGDVLFAVAVLSLQLNDKADAEIHLRKLAEIGHAEADKAHFYLGQIAADSNRRDEALQWFGKVGRGEQYLPARLQAANVLVKQGKLEEARQHLAASEVADPRERAQLLIGEVQILREAGRMADAHAVMEAGLERQPDQPELLYEAAMIAEKLGRHAEVERRLRRLIELMPDHAHAHNALGYSFADRNVNLAEAFALIERALQLAPNDPLILDSKGWTLFRMGDTPAALDVLGAAFRMRPDPEIAAHLGEVLWSLGRQDEARQTWEKARVEHPANEVLTETIKRLAP